MTTEEFARARASRLLQVLETGARVPHDGPQDWLGSTELLDAY